MRHTNIIGSSLLWLLAATASSSAGDGAYKEFKNWQVMCGQTQSCSMRQSISDNPISQFELRRSGTPEAPVVLVVSPRESALTEGDAPASVTLTVDDSDAIVLEGQAVKIDSLAGTISLSADFIGGGFIDQLKNGTTVKVKIERGEAKAEGEVGLAGAAASLLFIDEFQKRNGHTDAMTAKGDKTPNPALPVSDILTFADFPEKMRGYFKEGAICADTEETLFDGNALAHKIDENTTIYVTPCGMGGAYNLPFAVFVDSFDMVTQMAFPVMQDGAPSAMAVGYNVGYDYETRSLSGFFKGRGIGDCGTYSQWKLAENANGPALTLEEETFRDCPEQFDENGIIDPGTWPKTWPVK